MESQRNLIDAHLDPGETAVWSGQPLPDHAAWAGLPGRTWGLRLVFFALSVLVAAVFSACGVYLVWAAAQSFVAFDSLVKVLGAPMLLAFGLVFAVAPWIVVARPRLRNRAQARETVYVITGRRVLVLLIRDGEVADERFTPLPAIESVRVRFERADGAGDVSFDAPGAHADSDEDVAATRRVAALVGVADARSVADVLQDAIETHGGGVIPA